MAQVDFSNAVLDVKTGSKPFNDAYFLNFSYEPYFIDTTSGMPINTGSLSVLTNTPSKVSILYSGTFTANGTEFYMGNYRWKVSNVSFSSGDAYSFIVDIEVSGNT